MRVLESNNMGLSEYTQKVTLWRLTYSWNNES